ncbi:hypothetical protein MXB_5412, partial [Myxobolus squamalis]
MYIRPIRTGYSVVTLKDICSPISPFKLEVFVTTVKRVIVHHQKKTLTNVSSRVKVLVYNDLGEIVPNEEQHLIQIHFRFIDRSPDEILKNLNDISHHILYIYDPVILNPQIINMIPGMQLKLKTTGGPLYDVLTRYFVSGECVAFTSSNNSLFAHYKCRETVTAVVYSVDSDFSEIVYSEFTSAITVSEALKIEVDIVNNKFYHKTTVPANLHIFNSYGIITPFVSLNSSYVIKWVVEKPAYADFHFGYSSNHNDNVIIKTIKEGSTLIK